jgi:hypothetical protein
MHIDSVSMEINLKQAQAPKNETRRTHQLVTTVKNSHMSTVCRTSMVSLPLPCLSLDHQKKWVA